MKSNKEDTLGLVARTSLEIVSELRDHNDGPEKALLMEEKFDPLYKLLRTWSNSTSKPRCGSLEEVVFHIFTTAKTSMGMQTVSRKKAVAFLHKAVRLRMPPQSDNRRAVCLLFERIGELAGRERERLLPRRKE